LVQSYNQYRQAGSVLIQQGTFLVSLYSREGEEEEEKKTGEYSYFVFLRN